MQTQTRPSVVPIKAQERPESPSWTLHNFATTCEQLAQARAEVDRLEAEHSKRHAQAREILARNGNPAITGVFGDFFILRDIEGSITSIRASAVPCSSDFEVEDF